MAIKNKILECIFKTHLLCWLLSSIVTFAVSGAFAQGDYAPFEQPAKMKKITDQQKKVKQPLAPRRKPKDPGQTATIKVDGSAIYEAPNFDSPVLEYMDQNKKVKISKKLFPGVGGLGAFYKIRMRKGVFGYVADTDVALANKKGEDKDDDDEESARNEDEVDPSQIQPDMMGGDEDMMGAGIDNSFYLTRFMGLTYYSFSYAETIANKLKSASTPMYGFKMSGPTSFMGGMPLDVDFIFTSTAPSFYDDVAASTSGFMLIGDALVMIPLVEKKWLLINYGFGALIRYSKWDVTRLGASPGSPIDSQEVGLGAAVELGTAIRFSNYAIRLDGKYIYEKEKYFGVGAALQMKY